MKKFVLLMVLILAAGFCFAQDDADEAPPARAIEKIDLEITIGVPVHWTNSPTPHKDDYLGGSITGVDKRTTTNTAIGLALIYNVNKKWGLTIDTDFFVGTDLYGHSGNANDSNSATLFSANILMGAVFYLYNGNFLRIPLAVGVHGYVWTNDYWINGSGADVWHKMRDIQFGPGFSLGVQFHFNNSLYIFSRTNIAVDIVRWSQIVKSGGSNSTLEFKAVSWAVKPTIGIAVKF